MAPLHPHRVARPVIAAVAVGASLMLAACTSATANKSSSGGSSGGANVATDPQAKAAVDLVAKYKQAPTQIPLQTPLKSKPPTGKTFVWMQCDVSQCKDEGDGIKQAAQALGWNYQQLTYHSANPAELASGLQRALSLHPVAVGLSGLPVAVWQSVIPAYKSANVPIVVAYLGPEKLDNTVLLNVGGPVDVAEYGKMIGNWFIADSNAKGKALSIRTDDFPILKVYSDSFADTVKTGCSGCTVTDLKLTIPDVTGGKVNSAVVAALQKDPSINYVITDNGPFIDGLPAALAAAGLAGKVKIAGESGDVENLTAVKQGREHAFTGLALHYGAMLMVDAAARHMQGMDVPEGLGGLPKQLLTQDTQYTVSNSFDVPADYFDQLKKLWHVS